MPKILHSLQDVHAEIDRMFSDPADDPVLGFSDPATEYFFLLITENGASPEERLLIFFMDADRLAPELQAVAQQVLGRFGIVPERIDIDAEALGVSGIVPEEGGESLLSGMHYSEIIEWERDNTKALANAVLQEVFMLKEPFALSLDYNPLEDEE